jgi:hypothetical protein
LRVVVPAGLLPDIVAGGLDILVSDAAALEGSHHGIHGRLGLCLSHGDCRRLGLHAEIEDGNVRDGLDFSLSGDPDAFLLASHRDILGGSRGCCRSAACEYEHGQQKRQCRCNHHNPVLLHSNPPGRIRVGHP